MTTDVAEPEAAVAGQAAPMTPEAIMAAFAAAEALPRAALEAAEAAPEALFLDRIDRLARADLEAAGDERTFVFVYHPLAAWRGLP